MAKYDLIRKEIDRYIDNMTANYVDHDLPGCDRNTWNSTVRGRLLQITNGNAFMDPAQLKSYFEVKLAETPCWKCRGPVCLVEYFIARENANGPRFS